MPRPRKPASPFRYFNSSPEVIRLVVLIYVRFPLSLRNMEDLLFERGIDICHETVRMWWNRFGPMFAGDIRQRVSRMRGFRHWRWAVNAQLRTLTLFDLLPGCRRSNHFFAALRSGPTQAGGSASDRMFVRGK